MVQIVVDSSADFEPHELKEKNLTCIPITVQFGDKVYKENKNLSKEQFYYFMQSGYDFPKTSQPSPHEFRRVFHRFQKAGDDTILILLSSALTGIYQSAMLAKGLCKYENCYVIDSRTATAGIRILAEYAVRLRDQGRYALEIVRELETLKSQIRLYACLDTLQYLRKGGRISGFAAKFGNLANIKPVVSVSQDGRVKIPVKSFGKQKAAVHILKWIEQQNPNPDFPIYVMYAYERDAGIFFADKLRIAGFEIPDHRIVNVGAAIGAYVGPNAFGTAYVALPNMG